MMARAGPSFKNGYIYNFQFPLWDTKELQQFATEVYSIFQFPLWDTTLWNVY